MNPFREARGREFPVRPGKRSDLLFQQAEMYSLRWNLSRESEYEVLIGGESAGKMSTNLSGKLSVSVELAARIRMFR